METDKGSNAPTEALSAFELFPDKKLLEKTFDDDALRKAKESYGVVSLCSLFCSSFSLFCSIHLDAVLIAVWDEIYGYD